MNILTAHALFIANGPDSELLEVDPEWLYPAYCAAFASFSGMLDGCQNYDDLKDAVRHGQSLVNMKIVSMDGLQNKVRRVGRTRKSPLK